MITNLLGSKEIFETEFSTEDKGLFLVRVINSNGLWIITVKELLPDDASDDAPNLLDKN